MSYLSRTKVGVLRGGPSDEYEVSLKTGASVLQHLPIDRYAPIDILIHKDGTWHFQGRAIDPPQILRQLDAAFIALHGSYGEDGQVQRLLDTFGVPYTGSRAMSSATAMNKHHTKQRLQGTRVRLPRHIVVSIDEVSDPESFVLDVYNNFPQPCVIKPIASGSSVGVTIARTFEDIGPGMAKAFEHGDQIMIEEYIEGKEATCGVVEEFRGEALYPLLPIEIVPPRDRSFFDYDAKYTGITEEICPGRFTSEEKRELQRLASEIHETLALRHYSRSDFIVSPKGIYFLEVNTLPGLTTESLVPKALHAVGCGYGEFIDHLLRLAMQK